MPPTGRVTAYLFRSSADKRRLMGAGDTFIAKPWRREVYLQASGYPHPVLGYELAHVVAGSFAPVRSTSPARGRESTPTQVSSKVSRWRLRPTRMRLPRPSGHARCSTSSFPVAHPSFLFRFPRRERVKSYTVAGAFVRFVKEKYGVAVVKQWYGGAKLPSSPKARGPSSKPPGTPSSARSRFRRRPLPLPRPASTVPRCGDASAPDAVDLLRKDAERAQDRGDYIQAKRTYDDLLHLDPHDDNARLSLAGCLLRKGEKDEATKILSSVAATRPLRASSRTARCRNSPISISKRETTSRCTTLRAARRANARRRLAAHHRGQNRIPRGSESRKAIAAYLVGAPERGVDAMTAGALLGQWIAEDPADGLPEYLLGKDLVNRGLTPTPRNVSTARSPNAFRPDVCCARRSDSV